MTIKTYTEDIVRGELRSRIYAKYKNISAAAPHCGVTPQYLCRAINGNYPISDKVLKHFGMEKKITYFDIDNQDQLS